MVLDGRLQLLPHPARVEDAVERLGGQKIQPAAHTGDGRELERFYLDGYRCTSYSGLYGRGYGIITRYYPIRCKPEKRKPFRYARFARPSKPLEHLNFHS